MAEEMRNPCRECPLLGADKNNPECLECSDRVEYTRRLGGMSYGVPESLTGLTGREEKQSMEDQHIPGPDRKDIPGPQHESTAETVETKVCIQPGCESAGQALPKATAFYPADPRCKKCRHKVQAAQQWLRKNLSAEAYEEVKKNGNYFEARKRLREEKKAPPSPGIPTKPKAKQPHVESPPVFDLTTRAVDFTDEFKDLYSQVVALAKEELRPVEFQIAHLVRLGLKSHRQGKGDGS